MNAMPKPRERLPMSPQEGRRPVSDPAAPPGDGPEEVPPAQDRPALSASQQLAWDALLRRPTRGIPVWFIHPMEWRMIDRLAGLPEGSYVKEPESVYRRMLIRSGCCLVDQWIPRNPLTMGPSGYEGDAPRTATTGAGQTTRDGMLIDSPEAVVAHMERFVFPALERESAAFHEEAVARRILAEEVRVQALLGDELLKAPYTAPSARFPVFRYGAYGYENYFMAYALYPEIFERDFRLQAAVAVRHNRAAARAIAAGRLPPHIRLDHDMADSRGTLVDIRSLDRIWFPPFAHCIQPFLDAEVAAVWHCDGNLMSMVPRLIEAGIGGFQGFQYEDGMDYPAICRMKTRGGESPLIVAGVSVTRTLPHGTPAAVRRELAWLVENGPERGLFLGASSSIAPGVPWENLQALVEGFRYYRERGRS